MAATDTPTLTSVVTRYFDAWNGRDEHAIDGLLADAFRWTDPLLPAPLDSLEGAHGFMTGSWAGLSDIRFERIGEPLLDEAEGRVAQEWRMLFTHDGEFSGIPATGKSVDVTGTDVFTANAEGRVTEVRAYYDAATVMRQLGLA
jgi:steroid delta-isomerase-like uncharacterized protein